jgi:hypothetical protein
VTTATLAAACVLAIPQRGEAAAPCARYPYSYAGISSLNAHFGVAARISAVRLPNVRKGHVAAWVGVGGSGLGPNSTDEWLQVGISAKPGQDPALYYEVAVPHRPARYVPLTRHVPLGRAYDVAVLELRSHPGSWRVWVNGTRMTRPIYLPGSHGAWRPIVTAESWNSNSAGTCNAYAFRFSRVRVATKPGGPWRPLEGRVLADVGYRLEHERHGALLAVGG